ncbi:MAG TPA: ABC transporter permease [Mucilaginibacter sp.]|jgi:putative ABC transport system permease protein
MLKNILLTTRRTLIKNKTYSLVNIGGLTIGIAAYILISAYVNYENSYDRSFENAKGIYRVESSFYKGDQQTDSWPTSTNGYATAMKQNFPEIASIVRINWNNSERVIRYNNIKYREEHVCYADTNFFSFFSYPLIKGDAKTMLKDVNTIIISESAARKYFGQADPMGKFLEVTTLNNTLHCMVTGIFKDVPKNSTMQFNFLISWSTTPLFLRDFWYLHESYTFLTLKPGANPRQVEAKFPALAERYKTGLSLKNLKWAITLVPLTDIHLNAAKQYEIETKGNRNAVKFLSIIAFIILIIACINYINLSTAKAIERSKEVGIRKVNGANAAQLLFQFLFESFVIIGISLLIALIFVWFASYWLPQLLGDKFSFGLLFNGSLYQRIFLVFAICLVLTALYPAILLSRLNPVAVLKGRYSFSKTGVWLRKGMVTFQFAATLLLISGTFAVYRQLTYMSNQQLGVNIDQTIVLKSPVKTPDYAQKVQTFKQVLQSIKGVEGVTASGAVPGKEVAEFLSNRRYGASKNEERTYEMLKVDFDFIKNYNLQIVAGRAFDKGQPSDSTGIILNQASVKQLGFSSDEAAVGQRVWLETKEKSPDLVIGVIKDYHQQSLNQNYTPVILFMDPAFSWVPTRYYSVKFKSSNTDQIISSIKSHWNNYFPESSFDWFFLDDFYNRQYQQDLQFGHIFLIFSSLAILIACMGLFGLTAYSTSRRIKEIGVRKVLGASINSIITMLTLDVVKVVLFSSLLALPLSYLFIGEWLHAYAFRAALTWWQFVVPVALLLVIAVTTIGYITFKAAAANPVRSLKDE